MAIISYFLTASILLSANETSMNGDTILGTSLDPRVTRCGIRITGTQMDEIVPLIEASPSLSGRVHIDITKQSGSNTSQISQQVAFSGGTLGSVLAQIDRPSRAQVIMTIEDGEGQVVCRLRTELELVELPRDI